MTKAFYIISAVYRQRKEFDKADEFMERSSEVINFKKSAYSSFFLCKIFQVNARIRWITTRTHQIVKPRMRFGMF